ncbi:hypothetical protein [Aeromonas veronii]|uniref:hypothetical protein n=1 Tax=Aeromonas veronii TaxID=654 RepID=UPI003D19CED7
MFSPRYTAQLNNNNLIVIEDIIEAYKTDTITLSHNDAYAVNHSCYEPRDHYISTQLDTLYPAEVALIMDGFDLGYGMSAELQQNPDVDGTVFRSVVAQLLTYVRELTDRMVQEHYSAQDQFTFMMATA